jgi:glycosyltransferase involved in cell wall biosynthesis
MSESPLVSVVVPVENGERYLGQAIASIFAQEYAPFQVIVVDGRSVDRTRQIAESFASVRYLRQPGHGVADAYNAGISTARGEFVAFLSHDDMWTPDKLRVQVNFLVAHPEIRYSIARVKFFLEPGCTPPQGFREELLEGDHVGYIMETLVARRDVFARVGLLDGRLPIGNDTDWFARAHDARVAMAALPNVLLKKRIHDANLSSDRSRAHQDLLTIIKDSIDRKHREHAPQHARE